MDINFLTQEELQKEKETLFQDYKQEWAEIEESMHQMYLRLETLIYTFDIDIDNTENNTDDEIVSLYNDLGRMLYG